MERNEALKKDCPVTRLKCSSLCRQWVWETELCIVTCPVCGGSGQNSVGFILTDCWECDGSGIVQVRHGKCLLESQQGG